MATKKEPTDGFDDVLKHIDKLPDIKKKLAYLIEEKTKWLQSSSDFWKLPGDRDFADKCDLEINKYKQLAELEKEHQAKRGKLLESGRLKSLSEETGPRPWGVPDARG